MLHGFLLMLVRVDTGYFFDGAGAQVPDVEVAAAGAEEDSGVVLRGVECGGCKRGILYVERGEERVWWVCGG